MRFRFLASVALCFSIGCGAAVEPEPAGGGGAGGDGTGPSPTRPPGSMTGGGSGTTTPGTPPGTTTPGTPPGTTTPGTPPGTTIPGTPPGTVPPTTPGMGGAGGMPGTVMPTPPGSSAAVPVVMVDVMGQKFIGRVKEDPLKNTLIGRMKVIVDHDGKGNLEGIEKRPAVLDVPIEIGYRGGASLYFFPKKPYKVEIRDPADTTKAMGVPILGMPKGKDWALVACYTDKTCSRNALTYWLGGELGRPYGAPRFRFVELFIDGKYEGLYHFQERLRRDKDRVDIPKVSDEAITGGYMVIRNGTGDNDPMGDWKSPDVGGGNIWSLAIPSSKDITPMQKAYIVGQINGFEALMASAMAFDPMKGYRSRIDVPSFVDFLIMQEFTKNADGYRRSAYTIKMPDDMGGKFYMGPLWDFDLGFGNSGGDSRWYSNEWIKPDLFVTDIMRLSGAPENIPIWWYKLLGDPAFQNDLKCRWHELRKNVITMTNVNAKLNRIIVDIAAARVRDQARWPTIGKKIWPNYWVGNSYEEEVEELRRWIDHRIRFMDAKLPGTCATVPAPTSGTALPMPSILPPSGTAKTSPALNPPAPSLAPLLGGQATMPPATMPPTTMPPATMPPPVITPPAGPVSCKRGLAFGRHSPEDIAALSRGISWYYNWSYKPEATIGDAYAKAGVEFVPMVWGGTFDVETVVAGIPAGAKYLLAFNEPNFGKQANLTPQRAAELWPKIQEIARRKNLKIVSPAINYCGNTCVVKDPFEWMDQFVAACKDCQIDYMAAHMYSCYGGGIRSMVEKMKKYGKPLWLTEFACEGDAETTLANQMRAMQQGVEVLENDPTVFRYAWFGGRTDRIPNVNTLGDNGKLTALGELYMTLPNKMACMR